MDSLPFFPSLGENKYPKRRRISRAGEKTRLAIGLMN